jgi:chromosome segregation ATPase
MSEPTTDPDAGEIVVGRAGLTAPTRPTHLGKPSAKAKEAGWGDEMSPTQRGKKRTTRAIRAPPAETDIEHADNAQKGRTNSETGEALLLRVLEELSYLKDASKKHEELSGDLHGQLDSSQQELRETKDELRTVREQLETLTTTIALSQCRTGCA